MGDVNMCEKFKSLLDGYIDNTLTSDEMAFMKAHAKKCFECAEEMRLSDIIRNEVTGMDDDVVVPLKAQSAWRNAVRKEIRQKKFKKAYKALSGIAAALIVLVGATIMMRSSGTLPAKVIEPEQTANAPAVFMLTKAYDNSEFDVVPETAARARSTAAATGYVLEADGETDDVILTDAQGENIIKSCDIVSKTKTVDEDIQTIYDLTEEYEGYVSELIRDYAESGDHVEMVSRIPVDLMDDYISAAENIGEIISVSRFSQNADEIYYDIDSRLESKRALAEEINARMKEADEETLLLMNEEINKVYAEIDTLTRLFNTRESDLEYAKVKITLLGEYYSLVTPAESTLADRSAQGFMQSLHAVGDFLKDMVVSVAVIAPVVLLLAAIALVALFTAKSVKRNRKNKKEDGDE